MFCMIALFIFQGSVLEQDGKRGKYKNNVFRFIHDVIVTKYFYLVKFCNKNLDDVYLKLEKNYSLRLNLAMLKV